MWWVYLIFGVLSVLLYLTMGVFAVVVFTKSLKADDWRIFLLLCLVFPFILLRASKKQVMEYKKSQGGQNDTRQNRQNHRYGQCSG